MAMWEANKMLEPDASNTNVKTLSLKYLTKSYLQVITFFFFRIINGLVLFQCFITTKIANFDWNQIPCCKDVYKNNVIDCWEQYIKPLLHSPIHPPTQQQNFLPCTVKFLTVLKNFLIVLAINYVNQK